MIDDGAVFIQGRFSNSLHDSKERVRDFWDRKILTLDDNYNQSIEFIKNSQSLCDLKLVSLSVPEQEYFKVLAKINQDKRIKATVLSALFLPGLNNTIVIECCDIELIRNSFSEYSPQKYAQGNFMTIFLNVHITSLIGQKVRVRETVHRNQLGVIIDVNLEQKKALVQLPASLSMPQLDIYPSKPILFTHDFITQNKIPTLTEEFNLGYIGMCITVQKFRNKFFYESYELAHIKFSQLSTRNTSKIGNEIDPSEHVYAFLKNTIAYRKTLVISSPPLLEPQSQTVADVPVRTSSFDASNEEMTTSEDEAPSIIIKRKQRSTRSFQHVIEIQPTFKKRSISLRYTGQQNSLDIKSEVVAPVKPPEPKVAAPVKPPKVTEKPKVTWEPDQEYSHVTPKPLGKKISSSKDYQLQKVIPLLETINKMQPSEITKNGLCVNDTVITDKGDIGMVQSISDDNYSILTTSGRTVNVSFDVGVMRISDDNTVRDASKNRLFLNDVVVLPDPQKVKLGIVIHTLRNKAYVRDESTVSVHNGSILHRIEI